MTDNNLQPRTVHVVDDDVDMRSSIDWTLRKVGYDVRIHVDAEECLQQFDATQPTCMVVDLLLPGMTGLRLCQELPALRTTCAFVMISGHPDVPSVVEAMRGGAVDFLEKPFSRQTLLDAVQRALDFATRRHQALIEEEAAAARIASLSPREMQVFESVTEGMVSKEIATKFGISPKTVDVHRAKIMQKLRIDSPTQLGHLMSLNIRRRERFRST